ncbi:hypothetical protein BC567DRAFT_29747 [Phyllosticta citribraziliensis]
MGTGWANNSRGLLSLSDIRVCRSVGSAAIFESFFTYGLGGLLDIGIWVLAAGAWQLPVGVWEERGSSGGWVGLRACRTPHFHYCGHGHGHGNHGRRPSSSQAALGGCLMIWQAGYNLQKRDDLAPEPGGVRPSTHLRKGVIPSTRLESRTAAFCSIPGGGMTIFVFFLPFKRPPLCCCVCFFCLSLSGGLGAGRQAGRPAVGRWALTLTPLCHFLHGADDRSFALLVSSHSGLQVVPVCLLDCLFVVSLCANGLCASASACAFADVADIAENDDGDDAATAAGFAVAFAAPAVHAAKRQA